MGVAVIRGRRAGGRMRILGLDYGQKRVGVAVSDELGVAARGIGFIRRESDRQLLGEVGKLVLEYQVEKIVIGYPVRTDGTKGPECERVDGFAALAAESLALPVVRWDETLTTKEAEGYLIEAGVPWKKRRGMIDSLSAAIILQEYLNRS